MDKFWILYPKDTDKNYLNLIYLWQTKYHNLLIYSYDIDKSIPILSTAKFAGQHFLSHFHMIGWLASWLTIWGIILECAFALLTLIKLGQPQTAIIMRQTGMHTQFTCYIQLTGCTKLPGYSVFIAFGRDLQKINSHVQRCFNESHHWQKTYCKMLFYDDWLVRALFHQLDLHLRSHLYQAKRTKKWNGHNFVNSDAQKPHCAENPERSLLTDQFIGFRCLFTVTARKITSLLSIYSECRGNR